MTVNVTKPALNIREKLAELDKPSGIAGEAMLRADSVQEQRNLIGAGRKNWIINGDLRVSQRGDYTTATAYTTGAYYLDRWKLGATHSGTVQDLGSSVKYAATGATATGYIEAQQYIEDWEYLKGKTVTVSAYVTSNTPNAKLYAYDGVSLQLMGNHTGDGTKQYISGTTTLSSSTTSLRIFVSISSASGGNTSIAAGDYIEFTEVQLELGSVATDFEHRSYGEILADCQRYCYVFDGTQNQDLML